MNTETDTNAEDSSDQVIPYQGRHILHILYSIEHSQWSILSDEEQLEAKTDLTKLIQEIRASENTQLLTFSMVTPKADLGFMLLTDDLHKANEFEKKLTLSLGADVLTPVYSYLSMTELSEYTTSEEQYGETLVEEGVEKDSDEFNEKITYKVGTKYIKVFSEGGSVWGFVVNTDNDKKFRKGDILKAAGYAAPARNKARGNILDGGYTINWTGPLYL